MFFKENLMQIFSFRTPYHLTMGPLRSEKENWNKTPAAECPPLSSTLWGCVGQDSIMESRVDTAIAGELGSECLFWLQAQWHMHWPKHISVGGKTSMLYLM